MASDAVSVLILALIVGGLLYHLRYPFGRKFDREQRDFFEEFRRLQAERVKKGEGYE